MTRSIRRNLTVIVVLAALLACSGCATVYMDQVPVGPDARLVVGYAGQFLGPFPRIWVIEDGEAHRVDIVEGGAR